MKQEGIILKAENGKVLSRKVSGEIYGSEIYLGYSHYIGGVLQNPPHKDVAEDFEEIDAPLEWLEWLGVRDSVENWQEVNDSDVPEEWKGE